MQNYKSPENDLLLSLILKKSENSPGNIKDSKVVKVKAKKEKIKLDDVILSVSSQSICSSSDEWLQ